jgi:hypothetical protein
VTVEADGFKKAVNNNVELHVSDKATLDFALEVGPLEQTIDVSAEAPLRSGTQPRAGRR